MIEYGEIKKYRFNIVCEKKFKYKISDDSTIANRKDIESFLQRRFGDACIEYICIIALDNQNKVIGTHISEGTNNQCALYPSNVFRFVLLSGASSFIIAHNHPGGCPKPSEADWLVTNKLYTTGKTLEIPLVDHLIITDKKIISLRELQRWSF